jgi:regulator of sirC expression with transglutaminase-like and TPR domain
MVKENKLPYLISLVDDDTEEVRNEVFKELENYGIRLEQDIDNMDVSLDNETFKLIEPIIQENRKKYISEHWDQWTTLEDEYEQLEQAMSLLATFHYGNKPEYDLSKLLDDITAEFRQKYVLGTEIELVKFLFKEKGLAGEKDDYYNPLNSNLVYNLLEQKGIPISLASVLMLVGKRLGMNIEGCNFPGHFLAKLNFENNIILIDCFNGGKLIYEKDISYMIGNQEDAVLKTVREKTSVISIIRRTLTNLVNAYQIKEEKDNSDYFLQLLSMTPY